METAVYLNGTLRAIVRDKWLPEIMRLYPLLYPGQRIDYRDDGPIFDANGRMIDNDINREG